MTLQKSTLAAAVAATLALGISGQAAATVYAGSSLHIDDLTVAFGQAGIDTTGAPIFTPASNNVTVNLFNFTLTNTATVNSVIGANSYTTDACSGTVASNTCNKASDAPVTLYAGAANANGSAPQRLNAVAGGAYVPAAFAGADSTLKWFGIGAGDWSNSDSIIHTSELANLGNPSHTDQIAEANINNATDASSNSEIKSVTGFTFTFTVNGPNPVDFVLNFKADPDMRAQILNDTGTSFAAGANMNVSVTLNQNTGGNTLVNWNPQGTAANDCLSNITCTELADSEDLNRNVGTTVNNDAQDYSFGPNVPGLLPYGIFVHGLTAGQYTLTLNAVTSTSLTRTAAVPEPGMLALLGIGLSGLGFMTRRRKV